MIVSFIFLSKVFFPFSVTEQEHSDSSLSAPKPLHRGPTLKGQPCPGLLQTEAWVTQEVLPPQTRSPAAGWLCCAVSLWRPLPQSGTTAGLAVEECFVLALPAWASFFRLGMRKPGKTFLYNAEPTWGLGTSTQILLAVKYGKGYNFSASTYLSISQPLLRQGWSKRCSLSLGPEAQRG